MLQPQREPVIVVCIVETGEYRLRVPMKFSARSFAQRMRRADERMEREGNDFEPDMQQYYAFIDVFLQSGKVPQPQQGQYYTIAAYDESKYAGVHHAPARTLPVSETAPE